MAVYRIDLSYDGTGFRGYATNVAVRTVQGELERALATILGEPVETVVAGRTDAGVHARGQVVSFQWGATLDTDRVRRSLTTMLGPELVATGVTQAPDGFHARYSATSRSYRYTIDNGIAPDPMHRHRAWHIEWPLDLDLMNQAAQSLVGDRDFASLCRSGEGKTTTRTVYSASWRRKGQFVVFEVEGRAFCHQMVRSMVSLCIDVGRGRIDPASVPDIIEARDRNAASGAAKSHGLTLWSVGYESRTSMPAEVRASHTDPN